MVLCDNLKYNICSAHQIAHSIFMVSHEAFPLFHQLMHQVQGKHSHPEHVWMLHLMPKRLCINSSPATNASHYQKYMAREVRVFECLQHKEVCTFF